jgi:hypothetical protein
LAFERTNTVTKFDISTWDPTLAQIAQIARGHSRQLDHSQTKLERVGMKGIDGQKLAPTSF